MVAAWGRILFASTDIRGVRWPGVALAVVGLALPAALYAADSDPSTDAGIDWFILVMMLFGGLSFFLYGMERMGEAMKVVAGDRMRDILSALSDNRLVGLFTGTTVTAIIQSSSVTTVMLVGFVSAGLMTLPQAIGVILGAGIGTTITAQIVAFKVTKYALLLVTIGFGMFFLSRRDRTQQWGMMIMGLGMIFYGMSVMSTSMKPLRDFEPFINAMSGMSNPVFGILAGTAFTALIQSSSATMGIVIVLAMQGLISLEAGIALALGANIGTCVTAALAAIGKPREAIRVAAAHVLFKVIGVVLMAPFIPYFAELVVAVSPVGDPGLVGQEKLAAIVPRQVANAHTIFNVGVALLFLPFTGLFARFLTWAIGDREEPPERAIIETKFLNQLLLATPSLAIEAARREFRRMAKRVLRMYDGILDAVLEGTVEDVEAIRELDEEVDQLCAGIVAYLGDISKGRLDDQQTDAVMDFMSATNELESIGDVIQTDLAKLGKRRIERNITVSEHTCEVIHGIHALVGEALKTSLSAASRDSQRRAEQVVHMKYAVSEVVKDAERHQASRLIADEPGRVPAYMLEMDIIDKLGRVFYHSKRIAKSVTRHDPILPDVTEEFAVDRTHRQ